MQISLLIAICLSATFTMIGCTSHHGSKVQLIEQDGRFSLIADGSPFIIRGVGGTENLGMLAEYGGNTIRTWDAEGIGDLLDEAHSHGIRVVAGIWLDHQRLGFDYNDPAQREEQLNRVKWLVKEHRDHPALLAWGIGNEVEIGGDFEVALRQINDAAAIVKRLDPHHPRMAVTAEIGDDKAIRIQEDCPNIDFLGINSYGGLASLKERLGDQGYTGAWAVTEWGVLGHWESGKTPWGAPYEPSSGQKADFMREVHEGAIGPNLGETCLGSFAFLWGHKQEKTATWYGLKLISGEKTERVDVLRTLWSGTESTQLAPRVDGIDVVQGQPHGLMPSEEVVFRVNAYDANGDALDIAWAVIPESSVESVGGDFEESIEPIGVSIEQDGLVATITMPEGEGAYRIFVTVRDGQGGAGTANVPVYVAGSSDS